MAAPQGKSWRRGSAPLPAREERQLMDFASGAAHDIVGPVDQISSLVALFVQRYRGRLDDEADALLSHIETARARLGATAAALRKCFQVSTAQSDHAPVDMNAVVDSALSSLATQVAQCGADIRTEDLPAVAGSRDLLILLFQSLLDNAMKFRREGVQPRVLVSGSRDGDASIYQVSDNGIGIDPQYREVVFQSFKKLNGPAWPGAGLGLTMARFIVELHDGSIWIESSAGGTQVCFELPADLQSAGY